MTEVLNNLLEQNTKRIEELRNSEDWQQVFTYAAEAYMVNPLGKGEKVTGFNIDDVAFVDAMSEGENDGPNWLCTVVLKDGRWAFVEAGCDYTGWDCQASGDARIANDRETLITFGIDQSDRERLGYKLNE